MGLIIGSRQIERHMARGNEHMARGNEHMARGNEHLARGNVLMDEIRDEVRLTREIVRRNEIAFLDAHKVNAELVTAVRAQTEEVRAQTKAIFRLLDRLGPEQA